MNTKKTGIILPVLLLICQVMNSQTTVNRLFSEFSKEKEVERVGIGKFVMTFAGLFTDVMGVDGIEVLSFGACDSSVKERLNTAIASLKDKSYETMISTNQDSTRTKVLVKIDDSMIREVIVMSTGNDPALIRIKGKIKPADIENVINQNKK